MNYLLDTDKLIDFIDGEPSIVSTIETLIPGGVALSVISLAEYMYGAFFGKRFQKEHENLKAFLGAVKPRVLEINQPVAFRYAQLQADLAKQGLKGNIFDILIAATAIEHGLKLYTGNIKHFEHIPQLKLHQ